MWMLENDSVNCEVILALKKTIMYIYNITTNIEQDIHEEWLEWMENVFIPEMLATKKFSKALMTRVHIEEEMGGDTYSVQYTAKNAIDFQYFLDHHLDRIQKLNKEFEGRTVSFSTKMKIVHSHE